MLGRDQYSLTPTNTIPTATNHAEKKLSLFTTSLSRSLVVDLSLSCISPHVLAALCDLVSSPELPRLRVQRHSLSRFVVSLLLRGPRCCLAPPAEPIFPSPSFVDVIRSNLQLFKSINS